MEYDTLMFIWKRTKQIKRDGIKVLESDIVYNEMLENPETFEFEYTGYTYGWVKEQVRKIARRRKRR